MFYYPLNNGSPLFEAKYYSQCPHCNKKSKPGEMIGYLEDENKPSCEDCHYRLNSWEEW